MTTLQSIEQVGNEAVRKLRLQKLKNGFPFMINSRELESNQCYLEYPDGSILLVYLKKAAMDFTPIRTLSSSEEQSLRAKLGFPRI
jgi:hypothetical protein